MKNLMTLVCTLAVTVAFSLAAAAQGGANVRNTAAAQSRANDQEVSATQNKDDKQDKPTRQSAQKDRKAAQKADKKEAGPAPIIKFEVSEHDFGKVRESGKKVSFIYNLTNTGDAPLIITRVSASCKCVDATWSKKPIPPGGKGSITISYNPKKQSGVFYKAIQVYSNTAGQRDIITARGEVVD